MYIQLPDKDRKIKKTIYYPNAGVSVELRDESEEDNLHQVREIASIARESELAYLSSIKQLSESIKKVEEILVQKLSVAITISLPNLPAERMEHVLFAKQMFLAGEMDFAEYITKMRNLFPDRMNNLSEALKEQITERLQAETA